MKYFLKLFIILSFLSMVFEAKAYTHEFYYPYVEIDGFYILIIDRDSPSYIEGMNQASITFGIKDYSGDVVIPETVKYNGIEYTITGITFEAFRDCKNLTSIVLPSTMNMIGVSAFEDCTALSSVTWPANLSGVGGKAFKGCTGLKEVIIEDSPNYIPLFDNVFEGCNNLETLYVGRDFGYYFTDDEGTSRTYSPFRNMKSLKNIKFGNYCTYIDDKQFEGCSSIQEINIPASIGSILSKAFKDCTALTYLKVEDAEDAFGIWEDALENTSIKNIYMGRNLGFWADSPDNSETGVYSGTQNLTTLTNLEFGPMVKSIGFHAFEGCTALTNVIFPDNMEFILSYCFKNCSSLSKITLGSGVESIQKEAFAGCDNLRMVACRASTPPVAEESSFSKAAYSNAVLEVYETALNLYSSTSPWSFFSQIIGNDNVSVETILDASNNVDIFNLQGVCVKANASQSDIDALRPGIYIIGGKKVVVK